MLKEQSGLLRHQSGRVIALGRAMLSMLFLIAVWLDFTQPAQAEAETYVLLGGYVAVAWALVALTWNDWWSDAKLARVAHVLDICIFTLLVFSTAGYTSPFFLFFVFLLLSAAIRWGWRETALTALAVILLYLGAGWVSAERAGVDIELQRFFIRTGHLLILSALLIWFGVNQSLPRSTLSRDAFSPADPDEPPLENALLNAIRAVPARRGLLIWREAQDEEPVVVAYREGELRVQNRESPLRSATGSDRPLLYDIVRDRAISFNQPRRAQFHEASELIDLEAASRMGLREGLCVPLVLDQGSGALLLEGIEGLSVDHLDVGEQLAQATADHIRRHALLQAVEESGEARARLSLARDLHDSIVQFLAGAAFRIEAMMRQSPRGGDLGPELRELKRLMLEEQGDLRSFIGALQSGREVRLPQLAGDLQAIAAKLSKQWGIDCRFQARTDQQTVPMRLYLDAQQLVREAVANAVRHGRASRVGVRLSLEDDHLRLEIEDNGSGFPGAGTYASDPDELHPRSLSERVDEAGGKLELATMQSGTSLMIRLPIRGRT